MTRKLLIAASAALLVAGLGTTWALQQPATAPAKPSAIDLLKPYVGREYRIDAEWAGGGGKLIARQAWEWGLAKRFIVCKVYIAMPDGSEFQRYETIFADDNGKLAGHNLDFQGKVRTTHYDLAGNQMTDLWTVKGPGGKDIEFKQIITLTDADSYRWQVWNKASGDWTPMMDGVWKSAK